MTEFNAKIRKFTRCFLPGALAFFNMPADVPRLNLFHKLLQKLFTAFRQHFHPVIMEIPDPAVNTQTEGNFFGGVTESNALHPTTKKEVDAMRGNRFLVGGRFGHSSIITEFLWT